MYNGDSISSSCTTCWPAAKAITYRCHSDQVHIFVHDNTANFFCPDNEEWRGENWNVQYKQHFLQASQLICFDYLLLWLSFTSSRDPFHYVFQFSLSKDSLNDREENSFSSEISLCSVWLRNVYVYSCDCILNGTKQIMIILVEKLLCVINV